jgi:hypothetical protein
LKQKRGTKSETINKEYNNACRVAFNTPGRRRLTSLKKKPFSSAQESEHISI